MYADFYRVKTNAGYYYTTGNGRYGRVEGEKMWGEVLCELHANEVVKFLTDMVPQINPELERFNGHVKCRRCIEETK